MNNVKLFLCLLAALAWSTPVVNADRFFGDPPTEQHPWAVHDENRPLPPVVEPGEKPGDPPSDAIILFDGSEESWANWRHAREDERRKNDWIFTSEYMQPQRGSGDIESLAEFGDCQIHIEWAAPAEVKSSGQGRGNSGVFFMERAVEVQILDNYKNDTYADGSAGSVYGVMPPAANPLRAPGEWQTYDIIFRRPIVRDGVVLDEGSMTVLVNGVVVQDSTPLEGGGGYKKRKPLDTVFPDKGPLRLQDHGNPVRFRNIWYRPLRPRALDGGTDGRLSLEATMALRSETAAKLREEASEKNDVLDQALTYLESLIYKEDAGARKKGMKLVGAYLDKLENTSAPEINTYKDPTRELYRALKYLNDFDFLGKDVSAFHRADRVMEANGWKKR